MTKQDDPHLERLRRCIEDFEYLEELKLSCEGTSTEPILFLFLTIQYWRKATTASDKIRLFCHMHKQMTNKETPLRISTSLENKWGDAASLLEIDPDVSGLWYTDEKVSDIIYELEQQLATTLSEIRVEHISLVTPNSARTPHSNKEVTKMKRSVSSENMKERRASKILRFFKRIK